MPVVQYPMLVPPVQYAACRQTWQEEDTPSPVDQVPGGHRTRLLPPEHVYPGSQTEQNSGPVRLALSAYMPGTHAVQTLEPVYAHEPAAQARQVETLGAARAVLAVPGLQL